MTQLELPAISFARYFDLLKRRKWQVIPISLLGMLIGTVVALLVPRFYVAFTEVRYTAERSLAEKAKDIEEPLLERLDSARSLIPRQTPVVLQKLGWPEALTEDLDARAAFEFDVRSRIRIIDMGPNRKNRAFTNLRIEFRDTDGKRAEEFTNALRDAWLATERSELLGINERDIASVQERRRQVAEDLAAITDEIAAFERQHGLDPSLRGDLLVTDRALGSEKLQLEAERARLSRELGALDATIESDAQRILEGGIPESVEVPPPDVPEEIRILVTELALREAALTRQVGYFQPGSTQRAEIVKQLAAVKAEKEALSPRLAPKKMPNPLYLEQARSLDAKRANRNTIKGLLDEVEQRLAQIAARLTVLPTLHQQYREKLDRETAARKRLDEINAQLDAADGKGRELRSSSPYSIEQEARMPPRPTEPSVALLAIMGCLLGLGAAIGLVFALDAVRFTFKTMEDLERSLPVPVLGGVSHIETHLERSTTRRGRITVSVVAASILFLIVAVVTIYYVAPARLPTFARELLDMVLGEGD